MRDRGALQVTVIAVTVIAGCHHQTQQVSGRWQCGAFSSRLHAEQHGALPAEHGARCDVGNADCELAPLEFTQCQNFPIHRSSVLPGADH